MSAPETVVALGKSLAHPILAGTRTVLVTARPAGDGPRAWSVALVEADGRVRSEERFRGACSAAVGARGAAHVRVSALEGGAIAVRVELQA